MLFKILRRLHGLDLYGRERHNEDEDPDDDLNAGYRTISRTAAFLHGLDITMNSTG